MIDLVKGQRVTISENEKYGRFNIEITSDIANQYEIDYDIFNIIQNTENVITKNKLVFYSSPKLPDNSIKYSEKDTITDRFKCLYIDFSLIVPQIKEISLIMRIFKMNQNQNFENPLKISVSIKNLDINSYLFISNNTINLNSTNTVNLGKFYRYKNSWKFFYIEDKSTLNFIKYLKNLNLTHLN